MSADALPAALGAASPAPFDGPAAAPRPDAPPGRPAAPARHAAAIEYAIDGDLRFISHHDEIHLVTRALVRAAWPLAWSEGFNPQPRISVPLPRRTGTASLVQLAIVELREARDGDSLRDSLQRVFPPAARLLRVLAPLPRRAPHARLAQHEVELDVADASGLAEPIARFLAAGQTLIERRLGPGKPPRSIDIRPFVRSLSCEGATLRMQLGFDRQQTARAGEVIAALGLSAERYESFVRLTKIDWDLELAAETARPTETRKTLGQEEARPAGADDPHP